MKKLLNLQSRPRNGLHFSCLMSEELHSRNITRKISSSHHSLCYLVSSFLWVWAQFCFGQVITNQARESIHLSDVWHRGCCCETLSQLKGLSSVSTLRCLYSLIQRVKAGWQRGVQWKPNKTHMHFFTCAHTHSTSLVSFTWNFSSSTDAKVSLESLELCYRWVIYYSDSQFFHPIKIDFSTLCFRDPDPFEISLRVSI